MREALFGAVRPRCVLSPLSFPPPHQPQQPGTMGQADRKAQQPSLRFLPSEAGAVGLPGARAGAGMWNSRFLSGLDIGSQPKPALRTSPDQVPGVDVVRRAFELRVSCPGARRAGQAPVACALSSSLSAQLPLVGLLPRVPGPLGWAWSLHLTSHSPFQIWTPPETFLMHESLHKCQDLPE